MIDPQRLVFTIPGASAVDLDRAARAAHAVLEKAGVSAERAAIAAFKRDGWGEYDYDKAHAPTTQEHAAADAWLEAHKRGIQAATEGRPEAPNPDDCDMSLESLTRKSTFAKQPGRPSSWGPSGG